MSHGKGACCCQASHCRARPLQKPRKLSSCPPHPQLCQRAVGDSSCLLPASTSTAPLLWLLFPQRLREVPKHHHGAGRVRGLQQVPKTILKCLLAVPGTAHKGPCLLPQLCLPPAPLTGPTLPMLELRGHSPAWDLPPRAPGPTRKAGAATKPTQPTKLLHPSRWTRKLVSKKTHDHHYVGTPRDWKYFTGLNSERSCMSKCFFLFDPTRWCRIAVGQGTQLWYHAVGVLRTPLASRVTLCKVLGDQETISVTTFYLKKPGPRRGGVATSSF